MEGAPIQLTSVEKLSAARMACMWESIRPGMTVRPWASITFVLWSPSLRISVDVPRAA